MEDLCVTCLCEGRKLSIIDETVFHELFSQVINERPAMENTIQSSRVCWECVARIRGWHKFRIKAQHSYRILLDHDHQVSYKAVVSSPKLDIEHVLNCTIQPIEPMFKIKDEPLDNTEEIDIKTKIEDVEYMEPETFVNEICMELSPKPKTKKRKSLKKTKKNYKVGKSKRKRQKRVKCDTPKSPSIDDRDPVERLWENGSEEINENGHEAFSSDVKEDDVKENNFDKELQKPTKLKGNLALPSKKTMGEKPLCKECGKVFSSWKTFRYHWNVLHKGENGFPCPRCDKVYQWKSNLARHLRSHKDRETGELFCATCDKRFASMATYRQHLRISRRHVSENEFSFMCNECGQKFVSKTRLRDHIDWDHLKKIKFKCSLCCKPFKCHTSLYIHMKNVHHNKEKDLCHVCGKAYQNAAKLKYHIVAMHTTETPYKCVHCRASFGWCSSLYRHVREVHYKIRLKTKKPSNKKSKKTDALPPLGSAQVPLATLHIEPM